MRIIRGKYKGRHIPIPTGFKARPTTDFAKEGLFNILENNYTFFTEDNSTALDLFAGTGSIGLELASRGCSRVVSVEKDYRHWQYLQRIARQLQVTEWQPIHADVFKFCKQTREHYDIIFADPPYALPNLADLPDLVLGTAANPEDTLLRPDGLFILEHGKDYDFTEHPRFHSHRNYGSVHFSFFR
ncbi:MAG: RsmD family RNA methyltransferase [Bacteroidaceae bacterium]|nr:RsmD family RNA methyltransferase [Bacteroidaceae bacterium]